jgi:FAD/FMN-containing dehydrogenase
MSAARLRSWGRYPPLPQSATRAYWRDDVPPALDALTKCGATTIAHGLGRSYGDTCLAASGEVLETSLLDRFLRADWSQGIIEVEAGVTLNDILAVAVPRGWFLPVTPGTKHVTVAGAVANDVHGKNHHLRGTIGRHVLAFGLTRSDRGRLVCSADAETALFAATIGGLGLTGVIEWVALRLVRIASSNIVSVTERFGNLDEFFALSRERDHRHEFAVSWIDCTARGSAGGRGVHIVGDFADDGVLAVAPVRQRSVPVTLPFSPVTPATLRLFNTAYWRRAPAVGRRRTAGYEPFFYPLDGIGEWNRLYGARGFQQYQAVLPEATARAGIAEMLEAIAASGTGSFLAVLKRCGDLSSPGLLSFPMAGTSLALDFAQTDRLETAVFSRLDATVRAAGGRLYPAKDAHMSGEDFRAAYPAWQRVEALRDPTLLSHFWKRVTQ